MKQFIRRNKFISGIIVLCVVVFGVSTWAWWHYIYSNPQRVFNRMLAESLATTGLTKTTVQSEGTQSGAQISTLNINPTPILGSQTTSPGSQRELIATPAATYVRFTAIDLAQLGVENTSQDLSGVLNVWGKSPTLSGINGSTGEYNQALFGIVPVGQLSPQNRAALLAQIHNENVYEIDYSAVNRQIINGRPTYTYTVNIKPRAFISMLKSFSSYLGMKDFEQYDPNSYPESPLITVSMQVDVWSSQLTKVIYGDNQTAENYSGYGARVEIAEPTNYVSAEELQLKLQQIQ